MNFWPLPDCTSKHVPLSGPGSFAEDRGDRHHAAVDLYAPRGSKVVSTEPGIVIAKDKFTTPEEKSYWFVTYFVAIQGASGTIIKYCELEDVVVEIGDTMADGQIIGHVGNVLNFEKIDSTAPPYIQKIKNANNPSMLHFEQYSALPVTLENYSGGNWFDVEQPDNLLNPTDYLLALCKEEIYTEKIVAK